ncbi:hypothetical protein ACFRCW_03365 [Streptomyces sp. NPDC056653]
MGTVRTGGDTAAGRTAEQWWEWFFRYVPYGLLGLAAVISSS